MITEDYVSFEIAKLLRKRGFDEKCDKKYYGDDCSGPSYIRERWEDGGNIYPMSNSDLDDGSKYADISAPTIQMAMKWLREVHHIGIFPTTFYRHTKTFDGHNYGCTLVNLKTFDLIGNFEDCTFPADSYEQTCEKAIKYCLENLI